MKKRPLKAFANPSPAAGLSSEKRSQVKPNPEKGRNPSWTGTVAQVNPGCPGTASGVVGGGPGPPHHPHSAPPLGASSAVRVQALLFEPLGKRHVKPNFCNAILLVSVGADGLSWAVW